MKTDATLRKKSFFAENRKSGGYLLRSKLKTGTISVLRALLVFGLCFMIIQPILTRISTSVMPEADLYDSTIVLVPRNFTLDNFRIVFQLTSFPVSMLNSLWVSLLIAVLQVISSTLVAYGFARFDFPLKKFWFACVIVVIIVPPQTIATSLYIFFTNFDIFGLIKAITGKALNLRGSIAPYTLMSLTCMGLKNGLFIYIIMQYFKGIPKSLEEAAFMDGCGTMHTFVKIMLPDAVPVIISCFLFSFVWQFTDLFYTRNFLSTYTMYSTQLSSIISKMSRFFASEGQTSVVVPVGRQMQLVSIGVLICSTPLIFIYVFAQKYFVQSLSVSGMKE